MHICVNVFIGSNIRFFCINSKVLINQSLLDEMVVWGRVIFCMLYVWLLFFRRIVYNQLTDINDTT